MSLHQAIARRELANQLAAAQQPELSAPVLDQGQGGAVLASSGKGVFVIAGLTIGFGLLLGAAVMASSSSDAGPQKRE
ncbi:hypothetical protein SCE1572_36265 [Sorangium cellulosum So0157-2]|uniref:Uncharacterized protein n=2 Tax=Sorangium cellulosum TaxID=56 RepID=S4Y4W3_SORCE|nr:hypothetical protein SCE1572_36265 [Sorangium cellulosum So0157-2]